MENPGYWFLWMSPEEAEKHWAKPRKTKRTHSQSAATDVKPKWTRLSISCCFTCQAAALLNTDGGWLVRPIPLQLNDGPTASCPSGGKTLFEEEGSPWALLSLKLAENNPSNLVTSSANHNPPHPMFHQPQFKLPWALEARQRSTIAVFTVHLADVFPSLSWESLHFPSVRRKLAATLLFSRGSGEGVWPGMTSQGDRCSDECIPA